MDYKQHLQELRKLRVRYKYLEADRKRKEAEEWWKTINNLIDNLGPASAYQIMDLHPNKPKLD